MLALGLFSLTETIVVHRDRKSQPKRVTFFPSSALPTSSHHAAAVAKFGQQHDTIHDYQTCLLVDIFFQGKLLKQM